MPARALERRPGWLQVPTASCPSIAVRNGTKPRSCDPTPFQRHSGWLRPNAVQRHSGWLRPWLAPLKLATSRARPSPLAAATLREEERRLRGRLAQAAGGGWRQPGRRSVESSAVTPRGIWLSSPGQLQPKGQREVLAAQLPQWERQECRWLGRLNGRGGQRGNSRRVALAQATATR